ncbi:MAG: endonuclease III [Ignavibacteria bacterium]|nr:endonuclease III [Ignavibacteria bacterium]
MKDSSKKHEEISVTRVRTRKIINELQKDFPSSKTALRYRNPLELLIATILSAQCTDTRVNIVTKDLFKQYRNANDFARTKQEKLEGEIRSTGFYRNKARSIIGACRAIVDQHGGSVPKTMEELIRLPGVGRKTANCVLGGAFGINEGVVVDTHVRRLSQRLGLTAHSDPEEIEQDLMRVVPRELWYDFSNLLIWHGRNTCTARSPKCQTCSLASHCPSAIILSR